MSYGVAVLDSSGTALGWRELSRSRLRATEEAKRTRQAASRIRREAEQLRERVRRNARESIMIKWRARQLRYDRLGTIMAVWAGEGWRRLASVDPDVTEGVVDLRVKDSLHTVIGRLFSITVDISGALSLNRDPELRRRLQQILDKTDEVIRDLRAVASEVGSDGEVDKMIGGQGGRGCRPADGKASEVQPRELATTLLADAIHTIDRLARFARDNSEAAAMDLEEASHAAHRALVVLTPQSK